MHNKKNLNNREKPSEANYFSVVSNRYKTASRAIYILLVVVFAVTLLFNSKLLTYTNFNYLLRDLSSAAEAASDNYSSISYTNDETRVVKSYRGGIITASSTNMAIYTATGRKTLYLNESFSSPEIVTSKKYAIIYDLGGNKYSVYNSFAKVGSEIINYPISMVSVADNGWFAVVSKDAEHNSVIYLYDDDLKLKSTYSFSSSYVFDVDINSKTGKIAIVKSKTDLDKFSTSLMICELGKTEALFDIMVSSGVTYGGSFLSNGKFQLVCTDGYYMINENNGTIVKNYSFEGLNSNRISLTPEGCAISLKNNGISVNNKILVFDKKGELVYNTNINDTIMDMEYYNGYVFVYQNNLISKIDIKDNKTTTEKISENGTDIIIYDNNNILLCCETKAKYLKI